MLFQMDSVSNIVYVSDPAFSFILSNCFPHFQIVSVLVISNPCPIFHLIILFSYLNQILSTLSNAFNGSCINSLSAFSNLRGLLSYYLIVLFSYFQSLDRFLGALYHIIIGLFWGALSLLSYYHWAAFWHLLSYCSIIIELVVGSIFKWHYQCI